MPKFFGAGGGGGGTSLLKAEHTTGAGESITLTGLDLETDKFYRVEAHINNVSNGAITFMFNGDSTASNYSMRWQQVANNGSATAGASGGNATPNQFGNFPILLEMLLTKQAGKKAKILYRITCGDEGDGNHYYLHGAINYESTTNITSITITPAGTPAAGSYGRVVKTA